MRKASLTRHYGDDQGTFGRLTLDNGDYWQTGELPWRDNESGKSCIPVGTYIAHHIVSPKHGDCYILEDVEGRSDVEIHSANWMGDADKGLKCQLLGCIALGKEIGVLEGQKAVLRSKEALDEFLAELNGEEVQLTILE